MLTVGPNEDLGAQRWRYSLESAPMKIVSLALRSAQEVTSFNLALGISPMRSQLASLSCGITLASVVSACSIQFLQPTNLMRVCLLVNPRAYHIWYSLGALVEQIHLHALSICVISARQVVSQAVPSGWPVCM